MSNLVATALFHHEFCAAYGVPEHTFQLGQGYLPLDTNSKDLWKAIDPIPPASINQIAGMSGSLFSQNYGATLLDLNDKKYLVEQANVMWNKAGGFGPTKGYTLEHYDVTDRIVSAGSLQFSVDTGKITHAARAILNSDSTKVQTPTGVLERVTPATNSAQITIKADFDHIATFPANPLSSATQVGPTSYAGWYLNVALNYAYDDSKGTAGFWKKPEYWSRVFGDSGSLPRRCTGLVIADGYTYTITSRASTSPQAGGGMSPASSEPSPVDPIAGVRHLVPLGAIQMPHAVLQNMTPSTIATHIFTSPPGNPVILGLIVTPLPNYL